jgi:(S)-2-hydroxyglutarate dehydrogenase
VRKKKLFNSKKYDFIIIGAGIIGLSVAKELSEQFPKAGIAIIEKEKSMGKHASGRNSGVLHSGIYYPQDSLKAAVCSEGARRLRQFAKEHQIACHQTGKLIIATNEQELTMLDSLLNNAKNNNIKAWHVDEQQIKEIEPYASPFQSGIFTPDTASIDSQAVLKKLYEIVTARGVDIFFNQPVVRAHSQHNTVMTLTETFSYDYLFNCAGAGTDALAKMFGLAKNYTLLPFKGIYYKLKKEKTDWIKGNIYPVPDLKLPFLGVHFTRTIEGHVYVGPTAIPAFGRENYGLIKGISMEGFRIAKDIALLYIANLQNFRELIHSEIKKYAKPYFMNAAKKLVSSVHSDDLETSNKVGIRPQLVNMSQRKLEMDYILEHDKHSIHVLNAISPAFTGSFCFAELLVNRMQGKIADAGKKADRMV